MSGLFEDLADGRVREDGALQLLRRHPGLDRDARSAEDFRARIAQQMDAQHLVALRAEEDLAEAFAALVLGHEAAGESHRELQDLAEQISI